MPVLQNGQFVITINAEELARGLRPSKRVPRNTKYLNECVGAVGLDGVLQVLSDLSLSAVDVSALVGIVFPYPQLFVFEHSIIICSDATIFELVGGVIVPKLTVDPGILWSAVDFKDFIYMSNGMAAVIKSATSGIWSETTDQPIAGAMVNFNGQVMLGAYDSEMV
jgi:hypothetical protein